MHGKLVDGTIRGDSGESFAPFTLIALLFLQQNGQAIPLTCGAGMTEYFVSYYQSDELHCRCAVGTFTVEQVKEFIRQSDIEYQTHYVLHSVDELSLNEINNKRVHLAALEQYDRSIMAITYGVSRLRARHEWSPPQPVSDCILETFAQNAPPEYARLFLSQRHAEFMVKCQLIAACIRNPAAFDSAETSNLFECTGRYYREKQTIDKSPAIPNEDAIGNSPPTFTALTGVGVPDIVTAYQESIEAADGTPANVHDRTVLQAIQDNTTAVNALAEKIPTEQTIHDATFRALAHIKEPEWETESEAVHRKRKSGAKWKDILLDLKPNTKSEDIKSEVNAMQKRYYGAHPKDQR